MASVVWPWALVRPLYGPPLALLALAKFDWGGTVLFKGASVAATESADA